MFLSILAGNNEKIFVVSMFTHFRRCSDDLRCFFRKIACLNMVLIKMGNDTAMLAAVKFIQDIYCAHTVKNRIIGSVKSKLIFTGFNIAFAFSSSSEDLSYRYLDKSFMLPAIIQSLPFSRFYKMALHFPTLQIYHDQ